jgi:quinol monooxygenase YgiN
MIAVLAHFTITEGQNEAFEAVCAELSAQVRAGEPGAKLYQLVKDRKNPVIYKMMELYADKDALRAHGETEWFKQGSPKLRALLAEPPVIEILEAIG